MNTPNLLLRALHALHPAPDRYCSECLNRRENCTCRRHESRLADTREWALVPDGKAGAKKPVHDVWSQRNACVPLKPADVIQSTDRVWMVAFRASREIVQSLGGVGSSRFKAWKEDVLANQPPRWHPVLPDMVGQRVKDQLVAAHCIGRPRPNWEIIRMSDTKAHP